MVQPFVRADPPRQAAVDRSTQTLGVMNSTREKLARLRTLGKLRSRVCFAGYHTLAEYAGAVPDTNFVSPYTMGAKNVNSPIFILLQDWASDEYLRQRPSLALLKMGRDPSFPTNKRLEKLLVQYFRVSIEQTFATNLFPYIKPGKTGTFLPRADLAAAARLFAVPQIDIVEPRLVVCLGLQAFNAVAEALGKSTYQSIDQAIQKPFRHRTTQIYCQAHTGNRGESNRGASVVLQDWRRMAKRFPP